jgi:hypothetical protein
MKHRVCTYILQECVDDNGKAGNMKEKKNNISMSTIV